MKYTLHLDLPDTDPGVEVEVDGLGIYKNGESHELDDERVVFFTLKHGLSVEDAFENTKGVTVTTKEEE